MNLNQLALSNAHALMHQIEQLKLQNQSVTGSITGSLDMTVTATIAGVANGEQVGDFFQVDTQEELQRLIKHVNKLKDISYTLSLPQISLATIGGHAA